MTEPPSPTQEGRDLFRAFYLTKEYGRFPKDGGFLDQAAKYLNVLEFGDSVNVAYLRRRKAKEIEAAKSAELLGRLMSGSDS